MLDYWVDVETSGGARVGDGPITTAVGWESEDKLDRLGAFSFEMPASDARAALCTAKRVARCRTIRDGAVVDLGAGIIDKVTAQARTDGPAMLRVEGPNLLGELTYRSVGTLEMAARNVRDPDRIEWFEPAATFRSMWTWLTANANGGATSLTVTSSAGFIVGEAITLDLDGGGTHITTVAAIPDGTHINLVDAIPGVATPAATSGNQVWRSAATGYSPVTLSTDDFWYVGDAATFNTITITVNGTNPPGSGWTGNIHKATTVLEYWNGAAWAAIADFRDGTISLAHTGIITFAAPSDWGLTTVDGANLYWVRLSYTDEGTSDVWVADLKVDTVGPDYDTPNSIMALAPAGWTLGGDLTTLAGTSGVFNGENLLEALIRVAELTGEHFRLGTGRQVVWLNVATTASGARAVRLADPVEMEGETDACLITALQHSSDTHDLLTRIYPHAAGDGESVLTLEKTTRSAPAGYTLDKTNNYLKHDATETTYGQIERWIFESDVRPVDTSQQAAIDAANQLYDATKLRLDRAIAAVEAYSLTVTKLDQALNVGTTIRVIYDEWVDGYHAVAIDSNLVVLGATTQIDQAGARTVALDVASSAWWPKSDLEQLVQEQRATRQYTRHVQKVPATAIDALEVSAMKTLVTDGQGGATWMELERPVTSTYTAGPHNLFSAPHADTTGAASPVDGDIVIANATPKWSKLAISVPVANVLNVLGVANGELRPSWKSIFDATNPATLAVGTAAAPGTSLLAAHRDHAHAITSSSNPGAAASILASAADGGLQLLRLGIGADPDTDNRITMVDGGTIGQAAGPLLTFDDTNNYLEITGATVLVGLTSGFYGLLQVSSGFAKTDTANRAAALFGSNEGSTSFGMKVGVQGAATIAASAINLQTGDDTTNAGYLNLNPYGGNVGIGTTAPVVKATIVLVQADNAAASDATLAKSFLHLGGGEYGSGRYYLTTYGYSTGRTNPGAYIGALGAASTGYGKYNLVFGTRDVTTDTLPTERMRINTAGNLGLGTTDIEAWHTDYRAIEFYQSAIVAAQTSDALYVASNAYHDGVWKYKSANEAALYRTYDGTHVWFTAASGAANAAITWLSGTGSMVLSNLGFLSIQRSLYVGSSAGADPGDNNLTIDGVYYVGANQVVGARQTHVADADGTLASVTAQFNSLLAKLETHGLLAAA